MSEALREAVADAYDEVIPL
jgi:hypothetical protein